MPEYKFLTKEITLPVSGLQAVVKESDANAEDLLWAKGLENLHKALPDYWAALTLRIGDNERVGREDILSLLLPDQQFVAIEIFRVSTPDDILMLSGSLSGDGALSYAVNMGELDVIPLPDGAVGPDPTFIFKLPRTGHVVTYGYLTGRDELAELEIEGFNPTRMVFKAIRAIDGVPEVKLRDVKAWPLADHKALRADMKAKQCGYDTRVRFKDAGGKARVIDLLLDPSFLAPGLTL
jgi:hypothetical protein